MVNWKQAKKNNKNDNHETKKYPVGSCVVTFGELPLTIMLPPGTLKEQREILKERIRANLQAIEEQGIWTDEPPITDKELDDLVKKAKISHDTEEDTKKYFQHFGIEEKPSYSRELNEDTFELLKKHADNNSWEHTRVYGTFYQPNQNRFAVEINAMWRNVCNVTRLNDDEQLEVPTDDIIPAGQPGSLLMLRQKVEEYEKKHGLR